MVTTSPAVSAGDGEPATPGSPSSSSCSSARPESPNASASRRTRSISLAVYSAKFTTRGASPSGCMSTRRALSGGSSRWGDTPSAPQVQAMFPGARFARTSGVDTHHRILRFAWQLVGTDAAVVVDGIDIGVVGDDGRLTRIAGFYGPVAPMEQ